MAAESAPTFIGPKGEVRLKDTEWVVPVIVGTVAFYLGKKATEFQSHKWTLYLRGANNEDLSHFIKKVAFTLHPSFENHIRALDSQPFELTETGWGEFEISVTITFTDDAHEDDVEIFHKLKLFAGDAPEGGPQNPKKPVVTETYEELVFSEPTEAFYNRVKDHEVEPGPQISVVMHTLTFDPQDDLRVIYAARQKVVQMKANLQRELEQLI